MKIIREDSSLVAFGGIPIGMVFICVEDDSVYMKIPKVYEIETNGGGQESCWAYNAVCLSDGQPYLFADDDKVKFGRDVYLTVK